MHGGQAAASADCRCAARALRRPIQRSVARSTVRYVLGRTALGVTFGPFLSVEWLAALTQGLSTQEGWRLVAAFTQRVVENLRDGVSVSLDAEAARAAWNGEAQTLGVIAARVGGGGHKRRILRSVS